MSDFIKEVIKNNNQSIKYNEKIVTGEITIDNGDGTYNVKIANAGSAYPDVETVKNNASFSVGEIVTIGYEYGNKELPKIIGHSKKIKQIPKPVEVDYSGEEGGGVQTVETTINASLTLTTTIHLEDTNYGTSHNSANGADVDHYETDTGWASVGQWLENTIDYNIGRSYLYFDTSSIPIGATITSAILKIYVDANSDTPIIIVVQDGQPNYPHNPFINGDVLYSNYKNNGGQILSSAISASAYNNIILNSNGRNWITKGEWTKFCLRGNQDIANITPTVDWQYDAIEIDNTTNLIKLEITYTI